MLREFFFTSKAKAVILTLLLAGAGLFISFGNIFHRLDNIYFNGSEDGIKNYYTVQYHVLHDTSYTHFQGMNYPYGEHIIFTDNQPILANTLRFIHRHLFDLSGSIILIMNLAMLSSVILCAVFLCIIMLNHGVSWWYGALAAVGISFLSPQIARFADSGHYALSYSFYIPMLWYLWLRFLKRKTLATSSIIGTVIIVVSLLHLYYLPIGVFFGLFIWFFAFFKKLIKPEHLLHFFVQIILPLLIVQIWLKLTDDITDRPATPTGFLVHRAYWEGIFLPYNHSLGNFIHEHITNIRPLNFENKSYVGIVGTLFMLSLIFAFFKNIIGRHWRFLKSSAFTTELNVSFLAACAVALFSLGLPFILGDGEYLMQYIGPLKQFRGIGRFAWVFFYVINVLAFISIFNYVKNKSKWQYPLKLTFLVFPLLIIFYDIYEFHRTFNTGIRTYNYSPKVKEIPSPEKYQAMIPLPYFHIGSENLTMDTRCESLKHAADVSLSTGLPMSAVALSRNSARQSINQMQMHFPEYRPLRVLNDYPDERPLLLVAADNCVLNASDKLLVSKAKYIFRDKLSLYYSLPFSELQAYGTAATNNTLDLVKNLEIAQKGQYHYNSFNDSPANGYSRGGLKSLPGNELIIFNDILPADTVTEYIISFWAFCGNNPYGLSSIQINEFSPSGEKINDLSNAFYLIAKQIDGEWVLMEQKFKLKQPGNRVQVILLNPNLKEESIYADELLIRPEGKNVLFPISDGIYINNLFYINTK